jgi:hypothetical protein
MSARTLLWKKDGRPTSMAIRSASMSANNPPFERDRSMRFIAKAFPGRRNKLLRVLYLRAMLSSSRRCPQEQPDHRCSIFLSIFVRRWSAGTELPAKHVCKPFSRSYSMHARIITLCECAASFVMLLLFHATGKHNLVGVERENDVLRRASHVMPISATLRFSPWQSRSGEGIAKV